jgi:hypothetical protein
MAAAARRRSPRQRDLSIRTPVDLVPSFDLPAAARIVREGASAPLDGRPQAEIGMLLMTMQEPLSSSLVSSSVRVPSGVPPHVRIAIEREQRVEVSRQEPAKRAGVPGSS